MAQTGYTPIQLYHSTTGAAVPLAANLSPGELALNIADNDMTMYFENASGTVKKFFNNPAALTYPTADGTSGQAITTNASGTLSFGNISVPAGGTGITSATAYALIAGGTTSTSAFQSVSGLGNSGDILTSNGAGALPTWQTPAATGVSKGQSIAFALIFGM